MQPTKDLPEQSTENLTFHGEVSENIAEIEQSFINETSLNSEDFLNNDILLSKGFLLEELNISLKKWQFKLTWQTTKAQKAGIWHKIKKHQQTLDLDLSCLLYDDKAEIVERVWFKNVRDTAESIRYGGDELTGNKIVENHEKKIEQNHENITIFLPKIPQNITQVVFVLSSYTGHDLNLAQQGECSLIDDEGNDILNIKLSRLQDNAPAIWIATLTRHMNQWYFKEKLKILENYQQDHFEVAISKQLITLTD